MNEKNWTVGGKNVSQLKWRNQLFQSLGIRKRSQNQVVTSRQRKEWGQQWVHGKSHCEVLAELIGVNAHAGYSNRYKTFKMKEVVFYHSALFYFWRIVLHSEPCYLREVLIDWKSPEGRGMGAWERPTWGQLKELLGMIYFEKRKVRAPKNNILK